MNAARDLAGKVFNGGGLYVDRVGDFARKKRDENSVNASRGSIMPKKLLVTGLPVQFGGPKRLRQLFPTCKTVELPKWKKGGRDVAHGIVVFSTAGHAKEAFDKARDLTVDGKKVTVVYAQKKAQKEKAQKEKAKKEKAEREAEKKAKVKKGEDDVKAEDEDEDANLASDDDAQEEESEDELQNDEESEEEEGGSEDDDEEEREEEDGGSEDDDDEDVPNDEESDEGEDDIADSD